MISRRHLRHQGPNPRPGWGVGLAVLDGHTFWGGPCSQGSSLSVAWSFGGWPGQEREHGDSSLQGG